MVFNIDTEPYVSFKQKKQKGIEVNVHVHKDVVTANPFVAENKSHKNKLRCVCVCVCYFKYRFFIISILKMNYKWHLMVPYLGIRIYADIRQS